MIKFVTIIFILIFSIQFGCSQQLFRSNNGMINDYGDNDGVTFFEANVSGLADSINCNYGLATVCIDLIHKRTSDLKISLISPAGTEVWLTNRNGRGINYISTCFQMNGHNGYLHSADNPFTGFFIPDGSFKAFNNGQNPNGTWLLKIEDLEEDVSGAFTAFTISFSDETNCFAKTCSFDDPVNCCRSRRDGQLLPDLVLMENLTLSQQKFEKDADGKNWFHFTAAMANIGLGPLEIRRAGVSKTNYQDSTERINVYQAVYSLSEDYLFSVDSMLSGTIYFDSKPGHDHYHMDDWVNFSVLRKTKGKNPKNWEVIASSNKISYCLFDTHSCSKEGENCLYRGEYIGYESLQNYGLGNYFYCNEDVQGISVGALDYYGMNYEGQSILLPDIIVEGDYYLYYKLDPKSKFVEVDKRNNEGIVEINVF